ncbi:unnamed protein product [Calypogeia fissa]
MAFGRGAGAVSLLVCVEPSGERKSNGGAAASGRAAAAAEEQRISHTSARLTRLLTVVDLWTRLSLWAPHSRGTEAEAAAAAMLQGVDLGSTGADCSGVWEGRVMEE